MPYTDPGPSAGWKARETSREAAQAVAPTCEAIRQRIVALLAGKSDPMTADEITRALGIDGFTVRPRITELAKRGAIEDSGIRKPGSRGRTQTAWRAVEAET